MNDWMNWKKMDLKMVEFSFSLVKNAEEKAKSFSI